MEEKPLTESINKQYSKYGSLRDNRREQRIELCNSEDPIRFFSQIDSNIKDAKAKVKRTLDNSSISEDIDSSYDQPYSPTNCNDNTLGTIPLVKFDRNRAIFSKDTQQLNHNSSSVSGATSLSQDDSSSYFQSTSINNNNNNDNSNDRPMTPRTKQTTKPTNCNNEIDSD